MAVLRQLLTDHFSAGELQSVCFDLGVDYENLPGGGKADKARELVAYMARRGQTARLLAECQKLRPDVSWAQVTQPAGAPESPAAAPSSAAPAQPPAARYTASIGLALAVVALLASIGWFVRQPDFEPFIAGVVSLAAVIELLALRTRSSQLAVGGLAAAVLLGGAGYFYWAGAGVARQVSVNVRVAESDGDPIARARVALLFDGTSTGGRLTDSSGMVQFPAVAASSQATLLAEAGGYRVAEETVDISQDTTLRVTLERRDSNMRAILIRVVARVASTERFEPIPSAQVVLVVGADSFSTITDDNGLARFEVAFNDASLQADITVSTDGKAVSNQNVTLLPEQFQELRLNTANETLEIGNP